ncbi:MAG: bifunctional 4-hydroxy-2-oxoglutarate aldolase/2-dehydro-3-deoxy-phosphogluconate aldolase [Rhodothermales bacterium]
MSKSQIVERIVKEGAVAVIRADNPATLKQIIDALLAGGVSALEVTMTVPRALHIIEETANRFGDDILLGVGSVLDAETARLAINAGARYVVSPIFKPSIIEMAHRYNLPAMPGCFTPTEILEAHEAGADIVKVFPAGQLGMKYFKAIKAPMPHLQLMPTGGVNLTNAGEWIAAGACAVGVGSALLDKNAIEEGRFDQLTENAKILKQSLANTGS